MVEKFLSFVISENDHTSMLHMVAHCLVDFFAFLYKTWFALFIKISTLFINETYVIKAVIAIISLIITAYTIFYIIKKIINFLLKLTWASAFKILKFGVLSMGTNQKESSLKAKCGLCGSTKKPLTKTDCCNNWVCDYVHVYPEFSYARNSCYRNHDRYTLCAYHHHKSHEGLWQDCKKCKNNFDVPDYVNMGTNEYNFDVLKDKESDLEFEIRKNF